MYDVVAEDREIFDPDHATEAVFVFLFYSSQDRYLYKCLLHKVRALLYDLEGQLFLGLVIEDFNDFAKRPLVD